MPRIASAWCCPAATPIARLKPAIPPPPHHTRRKHAIKVSQVV